MAAGLLEQLNPKHPLHLLANQIPWDAFEEEFATLYSHTGQPGKPIRLMVGILILKQMDNLSDERVVEKWVENPYYQHFCGEREFQWKFPCDPSDLVHFRNRIGIKGMEWIFTISIAMHQEEALEKEIVVDTTVQEKNITYPTDTKLHARIIEKCVGIAQGAGVPLRRSYARTVKKLQMAQRFRRSPKTQKKAIKAARQLKTIAGRLVRELERKLNKDQQEKFAKKLGLFQRVLQQQRSDKNKVYSLHEPDVSCISKGKLHKKHEFGSKVSVAMTKTSGIIVGALSFKGNPYDGHTLPEVLDQVRRFRGELPKIAICDRGYRGRAKIGETEILIPKPPKKDATAHEKQKMRRRFRRRAAIEPIIGHLKSDHRMGRNFLKGVTGDEVNVLLAAAAFNFKKAMRALALFFVWIRMLVFGRVLPLVGSPMAQAGS